MDNKVHLHLIGTDEADKNRVIQVLEGFVAARTATGYIAFSAEKLERNEKWLITGATLHEPGPPPSEISLIPEVINTLSAAGFALQGATNER